MRSSSINDGGISGGAQRVAVEKTNNSFIYSIGLITATAVNMMQMHSVGPFITHSLMVTAFGGPQAILG